VRSCDSLRCHVVAEKRKTISHYVNDIIQLISKLDETQAQGIPSFHINRNDRDNRRSIGPAKLHKYRRRPRHAHHIYFYHTSTAFPTCTSSHYQPSRRAFVDS
jgi:hypothetical protein